MASWLEDWRKLDGGRQGTYTPNLIRDQFGMLIRSASDSRWANVASMLHSSLAQVSKRKRGLIKIGSSEARPILNGPWTGSSVGSQVSLWHNLWYNMLHWPRGKLYWIWKIVTARGKYKLSGQLERDGEVRMQKSFFVALSQAQR